MKLAEPVQNENGKIPAGWYWSSIDEIKGLGRSVISGPFGSNIGSRFFVPTGVPVIRGNNITNTMARFVDNGFVFVTEEKAKELNCDAVQDDLLFTAAGTIGQVGIIPRGSKYNRYVISNKQLRVRLNLEKVLPLFAFYWFSSPRMGAYIKARNTGSTIPLINLSVLRSLPIPMPPITQQAAIVNTLSSLDDKISLNDKMNENLEAISQSLFKRWFIDFEFPNGQGCTYKSSGGKLVDSELGKIPVNWHISTMPEIADIIDCLHTKKPERVESTEYFLLQLNNIGDRATVDLADKYGVSKEDYLEWAKNIEVTEGDCIITNAGLVGAIARIPAGIKSGIGRNFTAIRARNISPMYLFSYLTSEYGKTEIAGNEDQGTIFNSLNVKGIKKIKVLVPDEQVVNDYEVVAAKLRNILEANVLQNHSLAELRDSLLPRLMSGEIKISGC